jgi:hypothetical protein
MDDTTDVAKDGVQQAETGAARVRRVLIAPLLDLARPRGVADAQHRDNLDRLARKLSYMDEGPLAGLLGLCLGHSGLVAVSGSTRPACPKDSMILAWAYALQPPPLTVSDYPASVVRSAMGRRAHDGGYGVELLRHARRFGPPPQSYLVTKLQDEARENARRRAALRTEIEAGNRLDGGQARWMDAWHADAETVARLIAEGDERRAARDDAA